MVVSNAEKGTFMIDAARLGSSIVAEQSHLQVGDVQKSQKFLCAALQVFW